MLGIFSRIFVAKKKWKSAVEQSVPSLFPFRENLVVILKVLHPITMKQFQKTPARKVYWVNTALKTTFLYSQYSIAFIGDYNTIIPRAL